MDPELQALQQAIEVLHRLMTVMSDPQSVAVVGQCLQQLTKLQQMHMQAAQQGQGGGNPMAQAIAQRLQQGGGQGQPSPQGAY